MVTPFYNFIAFDSLSYLYHRHSTLRYLKYPLCQLKTIDAIVHGLRHWKKLPTFGLKAHEFRGFFQDIAQHKQQQSRLSRSTDVRGLWGKPGISQGFSQWECHGDIMGIWHDNMDPINIPQMWACIPYMDPMGIYIYNYIYIVIYIVI